MDVFNLRELVVSEYRGYVESFLRIRDERVANFVDAELAGGVFWPEALLQLNPVYEPGPTLPGLAEQGMSRRRRPPSSHDGTGRRSASTGHQEEAIGFARRGDPTLDDAARRLAPPARPPPLLTSWDREDWERGHPCPHPGAPKPCLLPPPDTLLPGQVPGRTRLLQWRWRRYAGAKRSPVGHDEGCQGSTGP